MPRRTRKWLAAALAAVLALPLGAALWVAVFGWNWARGPLQDLALRQTGRVLEIGGDLDVDLAWPVPRVQAEAVRFANPAWAAAPQLLTADVVDVSVDLRQLLVGRLVLPNVRLTRPRVFLEQASGGRRTWLLDRAQTDETARVFIGQLLLDQGEVDYVDAARRTSIHAELSTTDPPVTGATQGAAARSLVFQAKGRYLGQALAASGSGGAVLAVLDESTPYPLQVQVTVGKTGAKAEGTVTGLLTFAAADLQLSLHGDSLASLYALIGIALPPTPAHRSAGRLVRNGTTWRYESFAGQIGHSDLAGTLQVDTRGTRPVLSGTLTSRRLDLADLAPAIGARPDATAPASRHAASMPAATDASGARTARVLPDQPFDTAQWATLDADVTLDAQTLLHPEALPLDRLQLRLRLSDRVLALDPLTFGLAGGRLETRVTLDSRAEPLRGHAAGRLRGVQLNRLLPTVNLSKASIGQLAGEIDLAGQGASIGRMLATSEGRLSLVAQNGQISRLMMERAGLHLLEIMRLNLTGDQTVALNCAVADFRVRRGVMKAQALVLDTAVNTVLGTGDIDLAQERFDLTLVPRTKVNSPIALRSPLYVKGSLADPAIGIDTGRVVQRGAGALALGLVHPLLALIPLFEAGREVGPGCGELVRQAQSEPPKTRR